MRAVRRAVANPSAGLIPRTLSGDLVRASPLPVIGRILGVGVRCDSEMAEVNECFASTRRQRKRALKRAGL